MLLQKGIGAPRDFEASTAWFRRAAEQGHRLAMLELATAYDIGMGVPADPDAAARWRERARAAAEQAARKATDDPGNAQRVSPRRTRH